MSFPFIGVLGLVLKALPTIIYVIYNFVLQRPYIAKLGLRVVLGGSLATFMTATIAGLLNP